MAVLLLLPLAASCVALGQASSEAPKAADEATSGAPAPSSDGPSAPASTATVQKGLPPELTVDRERLDAEMEALQATFLYIEQNRPKGGFLSKIGSSIAGFFSGKPKPAPTTLEAITAAGGNWNAKLVLVEGLAEESDGKLALIAGSSRVLLT
ncbi:MAG: hypothetical protein FJX74_13270, partial [Armatimonadetes bacterium]|nr:hypothetical protein [Armatimonadota bacterium]